MTEQNKNTSTWHDKDLVNVGEVKESEQDEQNTSSLIEVEVVYGVPDKQAIVVIKIEEGTTVEQAIELSGIANLYKEIDLNINKVGIWNRVVKLTDVLQHGDRIEVYRPLIADPKEVRKRRAEKAIEEGRANKITGGRLKA